MSMDVNISNIFVGVATGAVAIATFLLWRATKKVAESTDATKEIAKEVGMYSIMPRFEIVNHERKAQDGYHQYAFKIINNGKDMAYNVVIETSSNDTSSTQHVPINFPVGYQVHITHSVHPNEKTVSFKIIFEDVAGNTHTRKLTYEITDEKLMGESISWELNKPFPDNVKM